MSADASGWTYRHSPYRGAVFAVHLAAADSVNDQNGNELWMAVGNIAAKARCERRTAGKALDQLVEAGFLDLVEERPGRPSLYRFLFPDVPVVVDNRRGEKVGPQAAPRRRTRVATPQGGAVSEPTHLGPDAAGVGADAALTQEEPKREPNGQPKLSVEESFDLFWQRYPTRNGIRVEKAKALEQWKRRTIDERRAAYRAVANYAAACDAGRLIAKDAFRWLRDRLWVEWVDPPPPPVANGGQRPRGGGPGAVDFLTAAATAREASNDATQTRADTTGGATDATR